MNDKPEKHYLLFAIARYVSDRCPEHYLDRIGVELHVNPVTLSEIEMAALKEADAADWESFMGIGYPVPSLHLEGTPRIGAVYGIRTVRDDSVPREVVRVVVREGYDDSAYDVALGKREFELGEIEP